MKHIFTTLALSCLIPATAFSFDLETSLSPDPAKMGKQTLVIQLKQDKNKVNSDTPISAKAIMPETHHMAEMVSVGKVEKQGVGKYAIRFNITMEGVWFLHVDVGPEKDKKKFVYEIETGKAGVKKVRP
jgi:hypothetical protein